MEILIQVATTLTILLVGVIMITWAAVEDAPEKFCDFLGWSFLIVVILDMVTGIAWVWL